MRYTDLANLEPGPQEFLKILDCRLEERFKTVVYEYATLGSLDNMLYGN